MNKEQGQFESNNISICITGDIDYGDIETIEVLKHYFDILNKYNVKATFFITAYAAERYPDRVEYILKNKHEISGHGDIHREFYGSVSNQRIRLENMKKTFLELFDIELNGFRAPWYKHNNNTYLALKKAGLSYDCSKKRFEIAFKHIPYIEQKYMYFPTYYFIKPFLKTIADIYNIYNKVYRHPYYITSSVLEIPTLGISDYTLIDDPRGPKYSPMDVEKIGRIWIECLSSLKQSGGGVLNLQAHPGRLSPKYLKALEYFIFNALKLGVEPSTVGEISKKYHIRENRL